MIFPSFTEFKEKLKKGNLVPVWGEIFVDFETPISALKKIDGGSYSFLLESVEGGEKWGRYSFLGSDPSLIFRSKGTYIEIIENGIIEKQNGNPIDSLKNLLSRYRPVVSPELPRFYGGAVGYFGYDIVRFIEKLPERAKDDLRSWDSYFMIADSVLVFDNINHIMKVISNAYVSSISEAKKVYDDAVLRIENLIDKLHSPLPLFKKTPINRSVNESSLFEFKSNLNPKEFMESVERTKEYIQAGDIIQAVISQRWSTKLDVLPFDLYRVLRVLNPSPYMFYLKMGDEYLVGSSPEVMVRVEGERVENRPIAGTRPRGKNEDEDTILEKELISDPKERAEHIMLVDLARNDLGRVAEVGTVRVDELMTVEKYSHVMHIVSNVIAKLQRGKDAFDVIRATFPAGTLSGAPKIRAMEIIEEMEPSRRGAYGGAVGYFSFSGNMDTCITIRTFVIKGEEVFIQAGAGIVADSDPEREYNETVNKVKALIKAIEVAKAGI
ncbi:MAG TPA: anthranilate synthase component I [Thermodesulfobacteriota bacterium]